MNNAWFRLSLKNGKFHGWLLNKNVLMRPSINSSENDDSFKVSLKDFKEIA